MMKIMIGLLNITGVLLEEVRGYFLSVVDAARKYNEMALIYHGEFARLNPIL